jgi:bifunctional DNA-binding transcriptional regulator/antitoxin component of YhaV-PrlF toxin-antitoxin module
MVSESTVLRDKGVLTLPVSLRRKYNLRAGDTFSVIDLGEGAIVLARRASRIDELGDRVAQMVQEAGYTPEQLMATLDEERERYYAEHYAGQE